MNRNCYKFEGLIHKVFYEILPNIDDEKPNGKRTPNTNRHSNSLSGINFPDIDDDMLRSHHICCNDRFHQILQSLEDRNLTPDDSILSWVHLTLMHAMRFL